MVQVILIWSGAFLAAALAAGSTPQLKEEGTAMAELDLQVEQPDGTEDDSVYPTAEDILRALQKKRPANRVIEPASMRARGSVPVKQALWPEGASLVSRTGRLVNEGRWWTFATDDEDDVTRLKLLPNATLEGMVRSSKGAASPLRFVVSGELTVFQDENYLLPRFATRARDTRSRAPSAPAVVVPAPKPADVTGESDTATDPVETDAAVDDVLARLREQRPVGEMISMAPMAAEHRAAQALMMGQAMMPDGTPLVERPGRLIAEGDWWTFVFESDHPEYPEPPMKLLPNQNVELMLEASARGVTGLVFIVSGEVTVFAGQNYLLPRAARRRIDAGNLRK